MPSGDLRSESSGVQQCVQEPAYPVARQVCGDDARFTYGLALEVPAVLARHGYPPVRAVADLVRVQRALFVMIYEVGWHAAAAHAPQLVRSHRRRGQGRR
jgi:hypothetical protein